MGGSPRGEPPRLYGVVKHLTMALLAMVIYGALHVPLGRIPVANGAGWDGIDYVAALCALIVDANGGARTTVVTT